MKWDLAFRRAKIIANGGTTNKLGKAEVSKLATTDFDSITEVPDNVKFTKDVQLSNSVDPLNINLDKWYKYNVLSHRLDPYPNVYIIKTSEGNYAKMQILSYYCSKEEKKVSSCYTIKYAYQGNGSKSFIKYASKSLN